jgi:hypothetical protein
MTYLRLSKQARSRYVIYFDRYWSLFEPLRTEVALLNFRVPLLIAWNKCCIASFPIRGRYKSASNGPVSLSLRTRYFGFYRPYCWLRAFGPAYRVDGGPQRAVATRREDGIAKTPYSTRILSSFPYLRFDLSGTTSREEDQFSLFIKNYDAFAFIGMVYMLLYTGNSLSPTYPVPV